jgi:hypothetical protein
MSGLFTILSFDIGIKNLAYCLLEYDASDSDLNFNIIEWDVINIENETNTCYHDTLFITLHKLFGQTHIDYVIIENQPALKNPVMKTIQIMVYSYFKHMQILNDKEIIDIRMCNACNKLRFAMKLYPISELNLKTPESNKYKRNKEAAIAYTSKLINAQDKRENIEFFESFKKKDDLADTLLQGLYFCSTLTKTVSTKRSKIIPIVSL